MGSSVPVQNNTGCDAMCHVIMWKMKRREPQNVCGELNVINCDESNYVVGFMVFLCFRNTSFGAVTCISKYLIYCGV